MLFLPLAGSVTHTKITAMFHKDLISLLEGNPLSLKDIAELLEMVPRDVEDDLRHLSKASGIQHTIR